MGCSGTVARLYRAPLPRNTARRDVLTELDCDNEALREQHRKAILSDKGLHLPPVGFRILMALH